jgi:hypothetical protein
MRVDDVAGNICDGPTVYCFSTCLKEVARPAACRASSACTGAATQGLVVNARHVMSCQSLQGTGFYNVER